MENLVMWLFIRNSAYQREILCSFSVYSNMQMTFWSIQMKRTDKIGSRTHLAVSFLWIVLLENNNSNNNNNQINVDLLIYICKLAAPLAGPFDRALIDCWSVR